MERISLKAYAVKHKLSLFDVMKLVKSEALKSEVFQEKGREVTYILYDEAEEKKRQEKSVSEEVKPLNSVEKALKTMREEIRALQKEVEALKKQMTKRA